MLKGSKRHSIKVCIPGVDFYTVVKWTCKGALRFSSSAYLQMRDQGAWIFKKWRLFLHCATTSWNKTTLWIWKLCYFLFLISVLLSLFLKTFILPPSFPSLSFLYCFHSFPIHSSFLSYKSLLTFIILFFLLHFMYFYLTFPSLCIIWILWFFLKTSI